jgi:hypothetical protein
MTEDQEELLEILKVALEFAKVNGLKMFGGFVLEENEGVGHTLAILDPWKVLPNLQQNSGFDESLPKNVRVGNA